MVGSPYAQYREMQVQTASPEQLVLMLYDGAIRFCTAAERAMEAEDYETAHNQVVRAQDVVYELMGTLNPAAGEVASNLFRLYEYFTYRLIQANLRRDPAPITEVAGLIGDLRGAWAEAIRSLHAPAQQVSPAAPLMAAHA